MRNGCTTGSFGGLGWSPASSLEAERAQFEGGRVPLPDDPKIRDTIKSDTTTGARL